MPHRETTRRPYRLTRYAVLIMSFWPLAVSALDYDLKLEVILPKAKGRGSWFQPRPAAIPGLGRDGAPQVMMTIQKAIGSDFFTGLSTMSTVDLGASWTEPKPHPELGWRPAEKGLNVGVCDFTLGWHARTRKLLGIGHTARYTKRGFAGFGHRRDTVYSVFDPEMGNWTPWVTLEFPKTSNDKYFFNGVHGQWLVEPDGTLLVPIYFVPPKKGFLLTGVVARLGFDGKDLGSYNTQQKWVTHSDGLFLVYTRRGANNDHIMRHRAPLFIAQVDPEKLCVIRATERVAVPERGRALGNFDATTINPRETWITVAGGEAFLARIVWSKPNGLAGRVN